MIYKALPSWFYHLITFCVKKRHKECNAILSNISKTKLKFNFLKKKKSKKFFFWEAFPLLMS